MTSQPVTSTVAAFRRLSEWLTQLMATMTCYMTSNIIYIEHGRGFLEGPWFSYLYYIHHVSNFTIYLAINSEFRNEIKRLVNSVINKHRPRSYV